MVQQGQVFQLASRKGRARASQRVRRASVGERRAARRAGTSPAMAPITIVEARPPAQAVAGMRLVAGIGASTRT
jgi:hypothetical protein